MTLTDEEKKIRKYQSDLRWKKQNPDKVKEARRRWYLKHKDEQIARVKKNQQKIITI